MSSTDDRIVKMQFDNASFKKGAAETQKSLADVDSAIAKAGKGKGLLDLNSSMEKVSVTASKMAVVTTTALATIANKATNVALNLANSLTLNPIRQGFAEYESLLTKQNTIMNATGKSANEVKRVLNNLNRYSDQTIYSFGNMTDAITKFVNAGVPLDRAVISIKGIANAAAFAGASSEEANRAMYAFSQSMSLGFIGLQDWMQIENANMGTVQFKNELLNAAVAAGTLKKQGDGFVTSSGKFISATKGWRDGLQEQWATTQVLNAALGKYADRNTELGKKAFKAAQDVRTFSAFMDTLKESLGSGWSSIFTSLFGNLNQSTKMWTGLSNAVGGVVHSFFEWLSTSLKTWRQMGGFKKTMEGFSNLLAPIGALLGAIGDAFRAAFPDSGAGSGKALYGLSAAFAAITTPLQWLADLIRLLTNPLKAFFQIIRIGGEGIGDIVGLVKDFVEGLFGMIDLKAPSAGGFLDWIKDLGNAIGDTLDKITELLNKGDSVKEAFSKISMPDLPGLPDIGGLFGGGGDKAKAGVQQASSGIGSLTAPLGGLGGFLEQVGNGFKTVGEDAKSAGGKVKSAGESMGNALENVWNWVVKVFENLNFEDIIASFNIAVLSTFMISVSRFLNALTGGFKRFNNIGDAFEQIMLSTNDAINSFAKSAARNSWANLILKTAAALLLLAAAMWILSKIPYDRLASGFIVIFGLFRLVSTTMQSMTKSLAKMDGNKSALKIIALAVSIGILAAAMTLLALSMLIYNKVDFTSVLKGTAVMFVAVKLMEQLANTVDGAAKKMIAGAAAIGLISGAMILLAGALLIFRYVKWESLAKAGLVLAGLTFAIKVLAEIPYEGIAKVGLALGLASAGMLVFATALIMFAAVKWSSIGKAAVVLALLTISLAALMFVGNPIAISGLVSMSAAMVGLALACLMLNKVNWSSIGKAAVVLAALLVAAALGAVIMTAFLYAVAPLSPVLFVIAAAIAALGIAFAAFAAGLSLALAIAAAGTAAFAALGTGAAVAIAVFVQTLAAEAPILKKAFLDMIRVFLEGIAESIPIIVQGLEAIWEAIKKEFEGKGADGAKKGGETWLTNLMEGLRKKRDEFFRWVGQLLEDFLQYIKDNPDKILSAGTFLLLKFLEGLATQVDDFMDVGFQMMTNFARAVGRNAGPLTDAGLKAVVDMLNGMAQALENNEGEVGDAVQRLTEAMIGVGAAIARGVAVGIAGERDSTRRSVVNLVSPLAGLAMNLIDAHSPSRVFMKIGQFLAQGLTVGIQNTAASAVVAVASMLSGTISTATEYVNKFLQTLDQRTIAAQAKAAGLAAAAAKAARSADRTESKKDDKAAEKLAERAEEAQDKADQLAAKAEKAKEKAERREQFLAADNAEKAEMRSEDAQTELDLAKKAELRAAAKLAAADALDKQAAKAGSAAERKKLQKEADKLREQARKDAQAANQHLKDAKSAAADALAYQKLAGDDAAAAFQKAFDADAQEAADEAAFEKLSNAEKAELRRKQAADLQAKAQKDLEEAKKLAYTDLEAANDLANVAIQEADKARQYLDEAQRLDSQALQGTGSSVGGVLGTVVNLAPTDAAAIAMQDFEDAYSSASAAAAASRTVEFNQYNTSPEALSPTEVYRQTNNLFAFAVEKLDGDGS